MLRLNIIVFIIAFLSIVLGFFIGWLNPIEGPYDYLYDNYASQPAHKRPLTGASQVEEKHFTINITDLSVEDLELMEEIFNRSKGQE